MSGVRDRAGIFCGHLSRWPDTEAIIRDHGAGAELDRLLAAFADDSPLDDTEVDGWINAVEEACARAGLVGVASRDHAYRPLPAGFSTAPAQVAWVCPRGDCDRVVLVTETTGVPTCTLAGSVPLKRFP